MFRTIANRLPSTSAFLKNAIIQSRLTGASVARNSSAIAHKLSCNSANTPSAAAVATAGSFLHTRALRQSAFLTSSSTSSPLSYWLSSFCNADRNGNFNGNTLNRADLNSNSLVGVRYFSSAYPQPLTPGPEQAHTRVYGAWAAPAPAMDSTSKAGLYLLIAAAIVGLGTLYYYDRYETRGDTSNMSIMLEKHPVVRQRVHDTYMYAAGGIALTALSAGLLFRSPALFRVLQYPIAFSLGTAAASLGCLLGMHFTPPEQTYLRHALWVGFSTLMGFSLAPLGFLGGPLISRAALGTGVIVSSTGVLASAAPDDTFMWMQAPLAIGLGIVVIASLGRLFFPASPALLNIALYGGLALFSAMMLYDVQVIRKMAKENPQYDPMQMSLNVYLNTINIFIRLVDILSRSSGSGNRRR